jgi:hypothetical protein
MVKELKKKATPEITWVCEKCGLTRSNKHTHKHGKEIGEPV